MANLICRAIDALAGYQAIDLHEVYRLFGGEGDPDLMPAETRRFLHSFMPRLGYRLRSVAEQQADEASFMWVRDPWPADERALANGRGVETYVAS